MTIKEAVTSVTWTADPGTQIGPGEFAEFDISGGPGPRHRNVGLPHDPDLQRRQGGPVG